jgi:hypothetical protein
VAADLRHYPQSRFHDAPAGAVRTEDTMTTALTRRSAKPDSLARGLPTVTPYIWVPDRGLLPTS